MSKFAPGEKGVVFLLMQGGHKTKINQKRPSEIQQLIAGAREREYPFVYIQDTQYGENNLIVDPRQVVAIVGADL
jgi:hypothetical protein